MKILSYVLTIASIIALIGCFFREELTFAIWPLAMLAVWTDKIAIDQEFRDFRNRCRNGRL